MASDADMEDYGYDYSDENQEDHDVVIENQYYNSKGMVETEPEEALSNFAEIVRMEPDKAEWGFKALKQTVKIYYRLGRYKEMMDAYREMLTYIKSAVTQDYSEKCINSIMDFISGSASQNTGLLQEFYETTLKSLEEVKIERLWFKMNLKLCNILFDICEYSRMSKILKELNKSCQKEDGTDDQKKGSQLLEVYAIEIQIYTETKDNKKLKELYQKALAIKSAIPHPRIMGIIRDCGGKMHMAERQWAEAASDFFEAFKNYDEAGNQRRIQCLKYLVLANMLMESEVNPFDGQEAKPYESDPEILAMTNLIAAYQRKEFIECEKIIKSYQKTIMDDPFIRNYMEDLLKKVRAQVLLKLIKPYKKIGIPFISIKLNVPEKEVMELLVSLMLDSKINGHIDEINRYFLIGHNATGRNLYNALNRLRVPMARKGFGTKGQKIPLLTNHFKVDVANLQDHFFHYSVAIFYDDGRPVEAKGLGRKILDKVHETYYYDLGGKQFAYDGEMTLFTYGALPSNKMDLTVVLEEVSVARTNGNASPTRNESPSNSDRKRLRRPNRSKKFRVEISCVAQIPLQALANAMGGQESENSQEAIRVLDIILRQHAARQRCLLVRQSFFNNDPSNCEEIYDNILSCRGFHSSFRTTQGGMSLNMDVTATIIIKPGPVVDFIIANQNTEDPFSVDWSEAKRTLKNLRIKVSPSNQEYRIAGMSEKPCSQQTFELKKRNPNDNEKFDTVEVTVADYFRETKHIDLQYSADLPCINVGKPKRPTYIPLELCSLIPLQRYTKALNTFQRSALLEKSRQKPQERMNVLSKALKVSNYGDVPLLRSCGISISSNFTQVEGRVLPAPKLTMGFGSETFPRNGRWNFNNKQFVEPTRIERWVVVNFSACCSLRQVVNDLIRIGGSKGIEIAPPFEVFDESNQFSHAPPLIRVETMFKDMQSVLPSVPQFILCLLPDKKNTNLYGPWKKKNLTEFGIVTQCMAPTLQPNDQYLTNLLLKINAKLGGLNSMLSVEGTTAFTMISKVPTIILGMGVSHGSPGPSIAAVVSSREWPLVSKYRASVRSQPSKAEMIESLFKKNGIADDGIIKELLVDFYTTSNRRKPEHIIIFRDGAGESQFNHVLNIELEQIMEACKFLDENWNPKFLLLVAQKNHHTRFFQTESPENVPPGTIIDNQICHPENNDFYLCAHAGMIGTTRPTHYHVLYDDIGFSPDELQELVHSLSYVYQRSTTAISVVAPIRYTHLAAAQFRTFMKFEDQSETSSSHGCIIAPGPISVPPLPKLRDNISDSMYFC